MSLRYKQRTKGAHPADRVLANCNRQDTVDCAKDSVAAIGLEIALFLELHEPASGGTPASGRVGSARFAYRNYKPGPLELTRRITSRSGQVAHHDSGDRLWIRGGREEDPFYERRIIEDQVEVSNETRAAEFEADCGVFSVEGGAKVYEARLRVELPAPGDRVACPCCGRRSDA